MASCEPRQSVHDNSIQFRVSAALLGRAKHAARTAGVSLSEFVRTALRHEVGRG
ncbi:ribbon-helix-helix protein, CopG family [Sphingomonas sp. LR59]|uniref:ribbon-helix-helix protein, CopG family n=1 Tax=Sphingomonas sp. LR59 TaxID=3050232 RepID=UPI003FA7CC63